MTGSGPGIVRRRRFLTVAGLTVSALAGCSGGSGSTTSTETPTETDTATSSPTDSPTPTSTDTATDEPTLEEKVELAEDSSLAANIEDVKEDYSGVIGSTAEGITANLLGEIDDFEDPSQDEAYNKAFTIAYSYFDGVEVDSDSGWDAFEHATMAAAEMLNNLDLIGGPDLTVTQIKNTEQTETVESGSEPVELLPTSYNDTGGFYPGLMVEDSSGLAVVDASRKEYHSSVKESEMMDGSRPALFFDHDFIVHMMDVLGGFEEDSIRELSSAAADAFNPLDSNDYDNIGFTPDWSDRVSKEVESESLATYVETLTKISDYSSEPDALSLDYHEGSVEIVEGMSEVRSSFDESKWM